MGGAPTWKFPAHGSNKLPPEYQYDSSSRTGSNLRPGVSLRLAIEKITGSRAIAFIIDPSGHTRRVTIKNASSPEFGASAQAMMRAWHFEPAGKEGKRCWALLAKVQKFDSEDRDTAVSNSALRLIHRLRRDPNAILSGPVGTRCSAARALSARADYARNYGRRELPATASSNLWSIAMATPNSRRSYPARARILAGPRRHNTRQLEVPTKGHQRSMASTPSPSTTCLVPSRNPEPCPAFSPSTVLADSPDLARTGRTIWWSCR